MKSIKEQIMNSSLENQVQWLVDRAQISELLFEFADCLDTRRFGDYAELWAEDGVMVLPGGFVIKKDKIEAGASHLGNFEITHHLSANHRIKIDGDSASSTSYLVCYHDVTTVSTGNEWIVLGVYTCEYVRLPEGWRFKSVELAYKWHTGFPQIDTKDEEFADYFESSSDSERAK